MAIHQSFFLQDCIGLETILSHVEITPRDVCRLASYVIYTVETLPMTSTVTSAVGRESPLQAVLVLGILLVLQMRRDSSPLSEQYRLACSSRFQLNLQRTDLKFDHLRR